MFRNALWIVALVAASAGAIVWHARLRATLPHLVYLTGWALLALMLVLTAYNGRKKLPFLALFSSRAWFLVHVYLGLFTGVAFLLHLNWRVPTGGFESVLAWLFVGVTASGLFGWWISRILPRRLTTAGNEVPYERIPIIARELRQRAEAIVLKTIPNAKATTLADFYARHVAGYLAAPAHGRAHLFNSRAPLARMMDRFTEVKEFLSAEEKIAADELAALVRQKDGLDYHRGNQLLLKTWLFVHIPLTYGLLVFSFVHVVLVYAYSGGAR